jgi:hypothetical protein
MEFDTKNFKKGKWCQMRPMELRILILKGE